MQQYRVMKPGHKVGHVRLPYGEIVTAKELKVKDADLQVYVARGILRPHRAVSPTPKPETGNKDD